MAENFRLDPNIPFAVNLERLYKCSKSQFGSPIIFGLFDKRYLRSFEAIKSELSNMPEWEGNEEDIKRYIELELLPPLTGQDKSPGFPDYSASRLIFLMKLERKWAYDPKKLKYIADFEESLIDNVYAAGDLAYTDLSDLDFFMAYLKDDISQDVLSLDYCKTPDDKNLCLECIKKNKDVLNYLEGKKFEDLPRESQEAISIDVFKLKWVNENSRNDGINQYQQKILCGFSPNVSITKHAESWRDKPISEEFGFSISDYPYSCDDKSYPTKQYFGNWTFHNPSTYMDFFSTPDFLIEKRDVDIVIQIRNSQKVDAKYMRDIDKIYVQYRRSFNLSKAGWGKRNGTKAMIIARNKRLREYYWQLREEKQPGSATHLIKLAIQEVFSVFGQIMSLQTARRIIYTKEDITTSGAGNS